MAVEKTNPRLTTTDIVELIAKKSNLTKSQVRECLQEFAELYKSLMASDNTPSDFTMPLPYVGTFKLKKYKGMKKGSTYKIPDWDNGGSIIKVAEEDRPDFNLPVFVVKPEIRSLGKRHLNVNGIGSIKMAKKDLTIDQLCNLIALESKLSPRTTRTVLDSLYKVVLKQLKLNERIYFMDFGAFETYERPSGDKKMGNFEEGETIIRYIAPKIKVLFKPSEALERAINEDDFTPPNRRKKNKKSRAQIVREYNERHKNERPTTEELLVKALNVSQARQENDDWKVRQAKK